MRFRWILYSVLVLGLSLAAFAQKAGWVEDASKAPLPATPVKGDFFGKPFVPKVFTIRLESEMSTGEGKDKKVYKTYQLKLATDDKFEPDMEATVSFMVKKGDTFAGKRYFVPFSTELFRDYTRAELIEEGLPFVQGNSLIFHENDEKIRASHADGSYTRSLQLQFGKPVGNKIPGKIYLCYMEKEKKLKGYVAGTFEAILLKEN